MAKYTYDAWGKLLTVTDGADNDISANASHPANLNPIRYRGYYYDGETGLFYVGSRYYDPVTSRYINADGQLNQMEGMTGFNLFQYCGNNPVNRADPTGVVKWIDYKKSNTEKGNSRDLGLRFWRNFIFAMPKALYASAKTAKTDLNVSRLRGKQRLRRRRIGI